jgi:hypothetical protein
MEPDDKKRMAARILGEFEQAHLDMLAFIDRYPDLLETPAQFQERCGQIALACFWKQTHGEDWFKPNLERIADRVESQHDERITANGFHS